MLITVDANILISALHSDDDHHSNAIRLLSLAERAIVELQATTRLDNDISRDPWKSKLKAIPTLSTYHIDASWRVGSTAIGNGDGIVGEPESRMLNELMSLIFPGAKKSDKKYANKINDVDHLFAHSKTSASMFVTSDVPILRNADKLAAKFVTMFPAFRIFLRPSAWIPKRPIKIGQGCGRFASGQ